MIGQIPEYRRILVPLDGSQVAVSALPHAVGLAKAVGASVRLLHVVGDSPRPEPLTEEEAVTEDITAHLETAKEEVLAQGVQCQWSITTGDPAREIVRYSREHQIDLIVMVTHGMGQRLELAFGSVARSVLERAPCPLLLIRWQGNRETSPSS